MSKISVFMVGCGFIGGSLFQSLLRTNKYRITVLTRGEDKAEKLRSLGATPLLGSLDSEELIIQATIDNDVIIHTATADDQPSVKAVLKGLAQRPLSKKPAVYIHTSGTGLIADSGEGLHASDHIYSDAKPEEIDALPDTAYHRDVDLLIKNAVEAREVGTAKDFAITQASLIKDPSIVLQFKFLFVLLCALHLILDLIPTPSVPQGWVKESIKSREVKVTGQGKSIWNHIHVANLVLAYETILESLLSDPPHHPLYYFAETGSHQWIDVAEKIHSVLLAKGLVGSELKFDPTPDYIGSNSRSKADLLPALGWKPTETLSLLDSIPLEIDAILESLSSK
ncbi:hypothetical protein P7C70_g6084, partial [Phenoliferia sp. Uapishka_3]